MKYKRSCLLIEVKNAYAINTVKMQEGKFLSSKVAEGSDKIGTGVGNIKAVTEKYNGLCEADLQ